MFQNEWTACFRIAGRLPSDYAPQIPICIFTNKVCFSVFEYLLLRESDIGRKIFWSSNDELLGIDTGNFNQIFYKDEIIIFVRDKFQKMKKLLKSMIEMENDFDYTFILLKLIQMKATNYVHFTLEQETGFSFPDIENQSLEECAFIYYDKYKNNRNILEDPNLSMFTHLMIYNRKFEVDEICEYNNFPYRWNMIYNLISEKGGDFDYRIFVEEMKKKNRKNAVISISIQDIDLMGGDEFEKFVATIFSKMGYDTTVTKHSGDFGIDVLAEKDEIKIGIQAKCYSGAVNNSAIQEVAAGMIYYHCDKGVVVTNSTFTRAAIELAISNSIQLWDRKILKEKIIELFSVSNELKIFYILI